MTDLIILNVPGTLTITPMAAPAILKSAVTKAGFTCKTVDFNQRFSTSFKNDNRQPELTNFFVHRNGNQETQDLAQAMVDEWVQEIVPLTPRFIGISVFTYQSRASTELFCFAIRKLLPDSKIILGGQGILDGGINGGKVWIDYLDKLKLFDHWVQSEGETAILEILNNRSGKEVLYFSQNQELDLDSLPYPNYDDYDFQLYQKKILPVTGSRGCVRSCTFCDIHTHWKKFVWRTGEKIAEEIIHQSLRYQIYKFNFTDSLVNGNQKEYRKMIKRLADHNTTAQQPISWSGQFILRPKSNSDDEMWRLTGLSGGRMLSIGIESGSESVRRHIGKEFTNDDIDHAMKLMKKYNVTCQFLMLFGYPTETEKDFQDTLDLFRRCKDYAGSVITDIEFGSTLGILPNTPLETNKEELGIILDPTHENFWINTNNPTLDFKERLRRRFLAIKTAESLGYSLSEDNHRDLLINFWDLYKSKNNVIPIKKVN